MYFLIQNSTLTTCLIHILSDALYFENNDTTLLKNIYFDISILYINAAVSIGKKEKKIGSHRLPFVDRVNGSLSFVRLFMKKQTEVIRLKTD
jgi:hypothetical protein